MQRGSFLQNWRVNIGFTLERVAEQARMEVDTLAGIEAGTYEPSFEDLDAIATVLGLRSEELYDEEVAHAAPLDSIRLLMKSAEAYRPSDAVRLRMLEAAAAARDLLDLRSELRPGRSGFEQFRARPLPAMSAAPYKLGDALAKQTRQDLSLEGPIPSMRDLAQETLGIPIVAAELTANGPDAFAVYAPGRRAVIVVNLNGKNSHPLVRRFSIAHEIGHVLYDRPGMGAFGIACHVDPKRGLDIESRANAFAMRLLLPHAPVKALGEEVLQPAKFRGLMETWGVHFRALSLFVEKALNLSGEEAKKQIPTVDRSSPNRWRDAEELVEERKGLQRIPTSRRGALAALVFEAINDDLISHARARELLHVDASVPLQELAAEADVSFESE